MAAILRCQDEAKVILIIIPINFEVHNQTSGELSISPIIF